VDNLASELELPASQLLGLFNRTIRRCVHYLTSILEHSIEQGLVQSRSDIVFNPVAKSMHDELEEAAKVISSKYTLCCVLWLPLYSMQMTSNIYRSPVLQELKFKQQQELEKLKRENLSQYAIKGSEEEWVQALGSSGKKLKNIVSVKR
jgi:N-acetyltransferase 10